MVARRLPDQRSTPGIVTVFLAPLGEEVGQAIIDFVRQDNRNRDELVTGLACAGGVDAFATEPECLARVGTLRNGQIDRAADGWHFDFAAEHGLVNGDGELDADVIAVALELLVRAHFDLDQRVASGTAEFAITAFTFEAENLAVFDAFGNIEVERIAAGHADALARATNGFEKVDLQRVADVLPANGAGLVARAAGIAARAATLSAKQIGEDVAETHILGATVAARACAVEAAGAGIGVARFARCVDLAGIIAPPLLGIAKQIIGLAHFFEALSGRSVAGIEVRVQFFGKCAKRALDVLIGRAARNTENGIGIR